MTPKTLDKYIAKAKKDYADQGWSLEEYHAEIQKMWNEMDDQYNSGKITYAEYMKASKKLNNADKKPELQGKTKTAVDTGGGYSSIANFSFSSFVQMTPSPADPGQKAADDAVLKLEKELNKVYESAAKDMQAKLKEFTDEYFDELVEKQQKVASGEMTQAELQEWVDHKGEMIDVMKQKIDVCTGVMLNANKKAMAMVNGETFNVFAENANYQSYQLTQDTGLNLMFSVYDEATVQKLIKEKPELLPRKVVDGKKDKAWNQKKIANAVTQSIIQGESIPDLAKRIAAQTASDNDKAMLRYARTAMTSAQNSGRIESMRRAKGMGIDVKKQWIATLDSHTRDAHQKLDEQVAEVEGYFESDYGKIRYPGDMHSKGSVAANLYNCRCALGYVYDGFPSDPTKDQRYDNETGQLITDMNYEEWKTAKQGSELNNLNTAKMQLAEAQKNVLGIDESKTYSDIWKDPVTLADYDAKKGTIQAKRDYYDAEIAKLQQAMANGESWATQDKINALKEKQKLLDEFEKNGQLIAKRDAALKNVQDIYDKIGYQKTAAAPLMPGKAAEAPKAGGKISPFTPDAYSQERKNKALWAKTPREADNHLRTVSGDVWQNASHAEKDAIYEYTQSYHKYNEPLRGYTYGTNAYVGVGNTDLNASYANNGKRLNAMTDIIDKSSYDEDIWLQRGCRYDGMDKFFNCPMSLLQSGSQRELENALLGTTPTEWAFMSCGSNKGSGLNVHQSGGILLNVYCPKGTKMMYVEPFSAYGGSGAGMSWDGKQKQSSFGTEVETLMQQGTQFRVTKVERSGRSGKIYVDMEVINQDHQQRWKP